MVTRTRTRRRGRAGGSVGLALAGGGPEGAIYEIGALRALEDAVEGLDLNALDAYVGVSAGAFLAACLANGITAREMSLAISRDVLGEHPFHPGIFYRPALRELLHRSVMIPRLLAEAVGDYLRRSSELSLVESFTRLARALPVGVFDNEPIRAYLERLFSRPGRTDDFRKLERKLIIVAADLDAGAPARFGEPGLDHVPISKAVQASTALPGLYPPVEIEGRYYVDGVLLKTLHASVAMDAGCRLLFCVNPIVPVDTARAVERRVMRRGHLVDRGLPTVLSQSLRTLIHSRLRTGMAAYRRSYPDRDVILVEPRRDDYRMFFTNIFSFAERRQVCEHAYRATLEDLRKRSRKIQPVLRRYGLSLRREVLNDPEATPWRDAGASALDPGASAPVTRKLEKTLERLERILADENA